MGRLGLGVRVSASFHILDLRMLLMNPRTTDASVSLLACMLQDLSEGDMHVF